MTKLATFCSPISKVEFKFSTFRPEQKLFIITPELFPDCRAAGALLAPNPAYKDYLGNLMPNWAWWHIFKSLGLPLEPDIEMIEKNISYVVTAKLNLFWEFRDHLGTFLETRLTHNSNWSPSNAQHL